MHTASGRFFVASFSALLSLSAFAVDWTGAAGDGYWTNRFNWSSNNLPAENAVLCFTGGVHRISLEGVTGSYNYMVIGSKENRSRPAVQITFHDGELSFTGTSATCIYDGTGPNKAGMILENVQASFNANIEATSNVVFVARKNSSMSFIDGTGKRVKLALGLFSDFVLDHSSFLGRTYFGAGSTFTMTKGSVFETKGEEMEQTLSVLTNYVSGGTYIVGAGTLTKGWNSASCFCNKYGIMGKLDEFVVNYPAGGTMYVKKPEKNGTGSNVAIKREGVLRIDAKGSDVVVTNQFLAELPSDGLIRSFEVTAGTRNRLYKNGSLKFRMRNCTLGDNSEVELIDKYATILTYGSARVSPTAKIKLGYADSDLDSGKTYPLFIGSPNGLDLKSTQFETGFANDSQWSVACLGQCAWLKDPNVPGSAAAASAVWTGGGADNKFSTAANWDTTGSTEMKKVCVFDSDRQSVINIDKAITISKRMEFATGCAAPFVITNNQLSFSRASDGGITSYSKYPVIYWTKVKGAQSVDAPTSIMNVIADYSGYIAFMNDYELGKKTLVMRGEVFFGSKASVGTVRLDAKQPNARATALHVLDGGEMTIGCQTNEITVASSIIVEGGGKLVVSNQTDAAFRYSTIENTHVVDGLLDIQAPFSGSANIGFVGTGVVNIASIVDPEAGSSVVKLAGGVTLKNTAWTAENISLAVAIGETATVVNNGSSAFDLKHVNSIGRDAELALATDSLRFSEADKAVDGIVKIDTDAIEISDDLAQAARSGFVTLLTAQDIIGELPTIDGYAMQIDDNGSAKTLKIRQRIGMMFIFK